MTWYNCTPPHPHNLEEWAMDERARRITRLIETKPFMTPRAAAIVIDAAMFGIGCTEGRVRDRIQKEKEKREHDTRG